jgi:two-component sensor histidine kinase/ActR/RegA family two-component response regulator
VKNTLATVISIAHLSFSKARSAEEARPSFDDRIRALAQTHARLAEANWSGVSLAALIRDETAPYQDGAHNVNVAGPDITLDPKCAVSLGMAIHELATNAAKHGALSAKGGSVQVAWERAPSQNEARLSWTESGGPAVSPPCHSGFGRMLLERALASDLNGKVKLEFRKEGLRCLIAFPLDQLSTRPSEHIDARGDGIVDAESVSPASPRPDDRNRSGEARILVVEDESLLAMELEQLLQSEGYSIVGPFSSLARAAESALREPIDLAILDTNLNGEMVYPLADNLSARGIPFIFLTGYGASDLPERFRAAPRIAKPYDPGALSRELLRRTTAKAAPPSCQPRNYVGRISGTLQRSAQA